MSVRFHNNPNWPAIQRAEEWIHDHSLELQAQYKGQTIAVWDDRVIAHDPDGIKVREQVCTTYPGVDPLYWDVPTDDDLLVL